MKKMIDKMAGKSLNAYKDFPVVEHKYNFSHYDGLALEDLYFDQDGKPIIISWADCDDSSTLRICLKISLLDLRSYIIDQIPFAEVIRRAEHILVYESDGQEITDLKEVSAEVIMKSPCAPTEESFLGLSKDDKSHVLNIMYSPGINIS